MGHITVILNRICVRLALDFLPSWFSPKSTTGCGFGLTPTTRLQFLSRKIIFPGRFGGRNWLTISGGVSDE